VKLKSQGFSGGESLGKNRRGEDMGGSKDGAVSPEWANTPAAVAKEQGVFQETVEPVVDFSLGLLRGSDLFFITCRRPDVDAAQGTLFEFVRTFCVHTMKGARIRDSSPLVASVVVVRRFPHTLQGVIVPVYHFEIDCQYGSAKTGKRGGS
jgi:hypothetical protein